MVCSESGSAAAFAVSTLRQVGLDDDPIKGTRLSIRLPSMGLELRRSVLCRLQPLQLLYTKTGAESKLTFMCMRAHCNSLCFADSAILRRDAITLQELCSLSGKPRTKPGSTPSVLLEFHDCAFELVQLSAEKDRFSTAMILPSAVIKILTVPSLLVTAVAGVSIKVYNARKAALEPFFEPFAFSCVVQRGELSSAPMSVSMQMEGSVIVNLTPSIWPVLLGQADSVGVIVADVGAPGALWTDVFSGDLCCHVLNHSGVGVLFWSELWVGEEATLLGPAAELHRCIPQCVPMSFGDTTEEQVLAPSITLQLQGCAQVVVPLRPDGMYRLDAHSTTPLFAREELLAGLLFCSVTSGNSRITCLLHTAVEVWNRTEHPIQLASDIPTSSAESHVLTIESMGRTYVPFHWLSLPVVYLRPGELHGWSGTPSLQLIDSHRHLKCVSLRSDGPPPYACTLSWPADPQPDLFDRRPGTSHGAQRSALPATFPAHR